MYWAKCRKCSGKKFWRVRRGKLRCKNCGYEFVPRIGKVSLTRDRWKALLKWFLRCQSINVVAEETRISKYKILKALELIRRVMILDIPEIFSGTVEVDETYLGGQWKYKRKSVKKNQKLSKRGLGTTRQPVFGILTRQGKVWATMVDDTEAKNLIPIIEKRITKGSRICSVNSLIPKTNNALEGVNSNLKQKLGDHRGMSTIRQAPFLSWYMAFTRVKTDKDLWKLWGYWKMAFLKK